MTDKLRQAAQQMLEAVADLTILTPREWQAVHGLKIDALRAALAEPDRMTPKELAERLEPVAWDDAQRICDLPAVDDAIRALIENQTNDNAVCVVQAILAEAPQPAKPVAREPVPKHCLKEIAAGRTPICARCNMGPCPHNTAAPQPAKPAEQEPVEVSPEFTDTARAALAEPARMTPAELADRLKRGEKWQLAEQPAESLDGKLVMGLAVIRELTGTQKTDNIEATIEAVRKAVASQPAIPPGYKLVPVEPTDAMFFDPDDACVNHGESAWAAFRRIYVRLLDAAPEAPQPAKREPLTDEEIRQIYEQPELAGSYFPALKKITRAIERAHGIGEQP